MSDFDTSFEINRSEPPMKPSQPQHVLPHVVDGTNPTNDQMDDFELGFDEDVYLYNWPCNS